MQTRIFPFPNNFFLSKMFGCALSNLNWITEKQAELEISTIGPNWLSILFQSNDSWLSIHFINCKCRLLNIGMCSSGIIKWKDEKDIFFSVAFLYLQQLRGVKMLRGLYHIFLSLFKRNEMDFLFDTLHTLTIYNI